MKIRAYVLWKLAIRIIIAPRQVRRQRFSVKYSRAQWRSVKSSDKRCKSNAQYSHNSRYWKERQRASLQIISAQLIQKLSAQLRRKKKRVTGRGCREGHFSSNSVRTSITRVRIYIYVYAEGDIDARVYGYIRIHRALWRQLVAHTNFPGIYGTAGPACLQLRARYREKERERRDTLYSAAAVFVRQFSAIRVSSFQWAVGRTSLRVCTGVLCLGNPVTFRNDKTKNNEKKRYWSVIKQLKFEANF